MSPQMPSTRSEALYLAACRLMPGGVNSPVRAFAAVGGTPRFIERASGPYLWDVDGSRYVDYVMSWGPLINGHAFPPVIDAIRNVASKGTSFGAPSELEVRLADRIVRALPSVEMVRFVSSGTEAAMSAIRLARAFTGRDIILKFAGNYHGHADALLAQAGSGSLTLGVPTSPGVPAAAAASTSIAPYNDMPALSAVFERHGRDLAAVIVEPIAGNMGVVPPAPGFLEAIREGADSCGALVIFDEVITGFRVGPGGAQAVYGVMPDLTVLGKIIGGGLPVGAYGGRSDIMSQISPAGPVYQAGTLSGNPLAMAAGLANLGPLDDSRFHADLASRTHRLAAGLQQAARDNDVSFHVNACTGMLTAFFRAGPVSALADAQASDTRSYARFFQAMLDRGFYLPPSQFEAWMISAAHSDDVIEETIAAAAEVLSNSNYP